MEEFRLFMKGQELEEAGQWYRAYRAYSRAGALKCAAKMKVRMMAHAQMPKRLKRLKHHTP